MKTNSYELTEEEKQLLCKMYASDKNIKEGDLYDYQARALDLYRDMTKYLKSKYSSKNFDIVSFESGNYFNTVVNLTFKEADCDRIYEVRVKEDESDSEKPEYEDNYYGSQYESAYSEYVSGKLSEVGIKAYVGVRINGMFDKNRSEIFPVEEIDKIYDKAKFNIIFYIDSTGLSEQRQNELVDKIEDSFRKDNQYGAYEVVYVDDLFSRFPNYNECAAERRKNREIGKTVRFRTFDVRGKE